MDSTRLTHEAAIERFRRITGYRRDGMTLQDIASMEDISAERVRQILAAGPPNPPGRPSMSEDNPLNTKDDGIPMTNATLEAPPAAFAAWVAPAPDTGAI